MIGSSGIVLRVQCGGSTMLRVRLSLGFTHAKYGTCVIEWVCIVNQDRGLGFKIYCWYCWAYLGTRCHPEKHAFLLLDLVGKTGKAISSYFTHHRSPGPFTNRSHCQYHIGLMLFRCLQGDNDLIRPTVTMEGDSGIGMACLCTQSITVPSLLLAVSIIAYNPQNPTAAPPKMLAALRCAWCPYYNT